MSESRHKVRIDFQTQTSYDWCTIRSLGMRLEGFLSVGLLFESGIYALVYRQEVVYVGQSKQIIRRLYEHRRNGLRRLHREPGWAKIKAIPFDDIWVRPVPIGQLDRVEREMIAKYRPRYNDKLVPKVTLPPEILAQLMPARITQSAPTIVRRV